METKNNKTITELNEDYVEIVKLAWKFPDAYNRTLAELQKEFLRRKVLPPIVKNALEYL